ncbi:MAG: tRNA (adenosine(37)-N6)-dimethylallyltransferase MiaA [Proteobacteria bacterium]|nr:tRNA (adenosine(37)-N6)-dimethylallyltransferase MiaA [Pseudomonadota bacterium]
MRKIIIIAGQTATGKSDIAFYLANELGGEIINADSIQVYKYFDIGSAKPPKEYRDKIPHHLIDILEPNEDFNAYIFKKLAEKKVTEIYSRNKIPIIVGGTGLYIRCFLYGLFEQNDSLIKEARKLWEKRLIEWGLEKLYDELLKIDPEFAEKIHPNDKIRIVRALEFYTATGEKMSDIHKKYGFHISPYNFTILIPHLEKDILLKRIEERTKKIFNEGIIEETKKIIELYGLNIKPLKSIGYKEAVMHIEGKISFDEAINMTIKSTKEYAKRQKIWFKKEKNVQFINAESPKQLKIFLEKAKKFLHNN